MNCENIDGILPLHGASAGNHLKVMVLVKLDFYFLRRTSERMKTFKVGTEVILILTNGFNTC